LGIFVSLSTISIILSLVLLMQILRQFPDRDSFRYFKLIMLSVAFWTLFAMLEVISINPTAKIIYSKLSYIGIVSTPVLCFFFSFEYAGKEAFLKEKRRLYFWIIPVIVLALVMTNELHGLIWSSIYPEKQLENLLVFRYERGPWFIINSIYCYSLTIMGIIHILITLVKFKTLKEHFIVLIGIITPLVGNGLYLTRLIEYDYAPPSFSLLCICLAWAIISGFFERKIAVSETIFRHLEEAILLIDEKFNIISMNPYAEELFKLPFKNQPLPAVGLLPFWDRIEGTLRDNMDEVLEVCLNYNEPPKWFTTRLYSIKDNTKYPGWIISMFDITDKKLYEEELQKGRIAAETANVAKSQFLANMSHEIRTPLNGIMGFTELLGNTYLDMEQKDFLKEIKNASNTLYNLINEVLDFSKIEAGKMELEKVDFTISELISSSVALVKHTSQKKGIEVCCNIEAGISEHLMGDILKLKQVMNNLVGNAVKFTEKGYVKIAVGKIREAEAEELIRFEISDTGVGIPLEAQEKLFQVFTQADSSTTRKYGGTGLGLAISKKLVELMGGRIWVESEAGKGSSFNFEVPLEKSLGVKQGTTSSESIEQEAPSSIHGSILLVEDIGANRKLVQIMLKKLGYICDIAVNGKEAVEVARQKKYDLIFMDCQMPVMDGYTATGLIKANDGLNNSTPIVAMTANALEGDREKCLEAGMEDFITKPINQQKLSEALKKWKVWKVGTDLSFQ